MPAHKNDSVDTYLADLEDALKDLPAAERKEIILETRSHVSERLERDQSVNVEQIFAELGSPKSYASGFLPASSDAGAIANIASVTSGGWRSIPLLLVIVFGYGIAALLLFIAVSKLLEPNATGWYVRTAGEHRSVGLVLSDPNHGGRDILGYWLIPITLIGAGVIHFIISRLLRRFARRR